MKFDEIIKGKYNILSEADPAGQGIPPPPAAPDAGMAGAPPPAPIAQPQPEQEKKPFDKPYTDLGQLLYKALRLNFESLSEEAQKSITDIAAQGAESIDSDEKGAALFQAVQKIVNDQDMVPPAKEV